MKRRRYTDEEKADLINRLLNDESLNIVSKETGINAVLLSRWRKEYQNNGRFGHRKGCKKDAIVTFEEAQVEIRHLRKQLENKALEVMVLRDMLKKNEADDQ